MELENELYIVIFVGLPAAGKSYMAGNLKGLFEDLGVRSEIFNLGNYRRKIFVGKEADSKFFNIANEDGVKAREMCAHLALEDAFAFLEKGGPAVALYDGTNTTLARRHWLREQLSKKLYKVIWMELILEVKELLEKNVLTSKVTGEDYKKVKSVDEAYVDFMKRIDEYKQGFTEIDVSEFSERTNHGFIKITNIGEKVEILKEIAVPCPIWALIVEFVKQVYTKRKSIAKEPETLTATSKDSISPIAQHQVATDLPHFLHLLRDEQTKVVHITRKKFSI